MQSALKENDLRSVLTHFQSQLLQFSSHLCSDQDLAADLAQQASLSFLRAIRNRKLPHFQEKKQVQKYLLTTVRNAFIDHCRRRERPFYGRSNCDPQVFSRETDPTADFGIKRLEVEDMLYSLPANLNELLKARFLCGESASNLANELRVTERTVNNRISAGLKLLLKREISDPTDFSSSSSN
ncbi:RNA polymerase sigma factor [Rhodopirellula baltica]